MSDYVTDLEAELLRAGRERQRRRARFARPGAGRLPGAGAVATASGVTVAIVIAALAVVLVGSNRPRSPFPAAGRVPAAAQRLVSMLAVLRRPQTSTDRALPASLLASEARADPPIAPNLTRLVAALPNAAATVTGRARPGIRVYLVVTAPRITPRTDAAGAALASIAWVSRAGSAVGFSVSPGVPAALLHARPVLRSTSGYNAEIVPDGVRRVRWSFNDGSEYVPVRENIAVASELRARSIRNGNPIVTLFAPKYLEAVTWYGTGGRVIASFQYGVGTPFGAGRLVRQINLRPPRTTRATAAGVVDVYKSRSGRGIKVQAAGLVPNTAHNAYAIWLYSSRTHSKLLGFVSPRVRADGRLSTAGALPANAGSYARILITLETHSSPKFPGPIVLEAGLRRG